MSDQITDIANKLSTTQEARNLLALLAAGPDMRKYLVDVFPTLTQNEQRVLVVMLVYRFMGAKLPLAESLWAHLPILAKMDFQVAAATVEQMIDKGVLVISDIEFAEEDDAEAGDGEAKATQKTKGRPCSMRVYSPPLEQVVQQALRDELGPQLVNLQGNALTR